MFIWFFPQKIAGHFKTAGRPRAAAFLPDGAKAYVTCETGGTICVIDTHEDKVIKTIKPPGTNVRPMGIVVSPDGAHVYVTTGRGGSVLDIDTATDEIERQLSNVGPRPWGIGITPDGSKLFTANGTSNDVAVIDAKSWQIVARLSCGQSPWGIAIAP